MCGRIVCFSPLDEIITALGAELDPIAKAAYQPSYNLPPSHPLPIVGQFMESDRAARAVPRQLTLASWGLLPRWAKDEALAFKTFNARAETVHEKPSFRGAFKYRRCLIPVNGFYEWHRSGKSKTPHYFSRVDEAFLVLAGLFEWWKDERLTCTVITTEANDMARGIHHRMPVILEKKDWQTWLEASPREAQDLLRPAANDSLRQHQVDCAVNNVKNDDANLIAPLS